MGYKWEIVREEFNWEWFLHKIIIIDLRRRMHADRHSNKTFTRAVAWVVFIAEDCIIEIECFDLPVDTFTELVIMSVLTWVDCLIVDEEILFALRCDEIHVDI